MDEQTEGPKAAKPWARSNLVALGSVAVFSVYSAGYFRTREAAERFAGEAVQRHAAAIAAPRSGNSAPTQAEASHAEKPVLPVMHLSSLSGEHAAGRAAEKTAGGTARAAREGVAKPATDNHQDTTTQGVSGPPASASATATAAAPTPASLAPAPAPPAIAAAPAPAPIAPSVATPTVDSAVVAKKDENALKDGVYYGWGTSRHGDIQASVEIKSGKIIGAYISQCLTQYSCSWVSALPGQVVQRQSAEVDYVSGATQSSNAFYYAVIDALKKAK